MNDDAAHDRMPDWYDPFEEPRTLPAGWDSAGLTGGEAAQPPAPAPRPGLPLRAPQLSVGFALN